MKAILIACLIAATTLSTFAQTKVPVKNEMSPVLVDLLAKVPNPKLVISRQATGNVAEGQTKFKSSAKSIPQGTTLTLANGGLNLPMKGEVNVVVLTYSFEEIELNEIHRIVELKKMQRVKLEEIVADMKAAGYRPATAEQVSAVRGKLAGKTAEDDIVLRVFGTVLQKDSHTYTMGVDYHYVMGTDILAYGDGFSKIGFYDQKDWSKDKIFLAAVKIDAGQDEKKDNTTPKKTSEKPETNKKK
jgi:hypothetical protein